MWFRIRRLREENADLRDQLARMRKRAETAEKTAATELAARRTITRQYAELDAANKRLHGRNKWLAERLEQAAPADWREERARLVKQLGLSERARRSLEEQRAELLAANDSMCREAVDRAGTLAKVAAGREPGEVA